MNREDFNQRLKAEIERQMRLRLAIVNLTIIAEKTQKKAFEVISNERFEMTVSTN
jgi:hypothetical protein